jgi:molecular chaperone GrpE
MTRKKDYKDEHPEAGVMSEERGREGEPGPAAGTDPRAEDPAGLQAELERARAREDELLRAVAELTNVNRRRKQDSETIAVSAQESLVRSILPILDDIDRALAASKDREGDPFRSGVLMIRERLWRTLEKEGLEAIEALGAPFDPELHDAVSQQPSADQPPGTVLEVILPGYRFKGRVIRHAQVVVAGPREGSSRGSAGAGQGKAAPGAEEFDF